MDFLINALVLRHICRIRARISFIHQIQWVPKKDLVCADALQSLFVKYRNNTLGARQNVTAAHVKAVKAYYITAELT